MTFWKQTVEDSVLNDIHHIYFQYWLSYFLQKQDTVLEIGELF